MIEVKRRKKSNFKLFFIITIIFFSLLTNAQTYPDFKNIDKKTYDFYENQNWDSLIIVGKEALKNNIDYFYLRVRLGMAYYQKQNYTKAVQNFEKALQFNSTDVFALECLYYSYLFLNRKQEIKLLSTKFPESLKSQLNITKEKFLNNIYFETGYTFSNNISKNGNINLFGNDSIYGEQDLNGTIFYAHVGLSKSIGKRISLYFGYSNLNIDKEKQIQYSESVLNRDSTVYSYWGY
ncbi:MAG: tetratricopeptide repeat protein, partial [Bacteroidales bacterium]|nr:tetratricopeptide repeat protein [Bacteroidales bacterium]